MGFDLGVHLAVGKVDERPTGEPGLGELAHLLPLVEPVLEDDVGLQLLGLGLVDFPPEELVALAAGYEAGLGEAVGAGGCGHERLTSMSFEYRPFEYSTIQRFRPVCYRTLPCSNCLSLCRVDVTNPRLILINAEEM